MDNEQLNSNLNELIKNQIEICEKLDKMSKRIKKISKPKKESNYDLNNIFGDPVEQLDKIKFKQAEPKQDQKYYLCIKNFYNIKEGTVLKFKEFDNITNCDLYTYKAVCGFPESVLFEDISKEPNFIPIQQFETLKEGKEIEFTLRNGKTYKARVFNLGNYFLGFGVLANDQVFKDLNQMAFKESLLSKYKDTFLHQYPYTPTLEDLTNDLNKLITLPDLSNEVKIDKDVELEKQANELIDKFMPLVNGWKTVQGVGYVGQDNKQWIYNTWCQRKAAIKCAIVHCELIIEKRSINHFKYKDLKSQLQKMLSE